MSTKESIIKLWAAQARAQDALEAIDKALLDVNGTMTYLSAAADILGIEKFPATNHLLLMHGELEALSSRGAIAVESIKRSVRFVQDT